MELFQTIGKVERAEIQYEPNGRSRGTGVVSFDNADNAETAICELIDWLCRILLTYCHSQIYRVPVWREASRLDLCQIFEP